ncbi:MAG: hypothetical protein Fur0037_12210 [Planctomycetota bacterium]
MSPIGRVFIVLNLLLAGTFVGFAGTYLQRQDDYNKLHQAERKARQEENKRNLAEINDLKQQVNTSEVAKATLERQVQGLTAENQRLSDDNAKKDRRLAEQELAQKSIASSVSAMSTELQAAFRQAKDAFDKAIAAESAKDAAVRERDDAASALKEANLKIAALEESGTQKDLKIAELEKKNGELDLLVSVARVKGFLDSMAVPPLAGTISHVAGRLVTIQINDNPTKAEIKPGYSFAVYEGTTYKGEARVTEADAERNVAFATLETVNGEVRVGDKANTKTN